VSTPREDWRAWHSRYDDPSCWLSERLDVVQARLAEALDAAPPGPLRVVSLCAGEGRDLIPVLAAHPRGGDVTARLVELDPHNASTARRSAAASGLTGVEVVTGDAALTGAYAGLVPAGIVLACGIFGNISEADIEHTIGCLPQLCGPDATVLWTRGRFEPDLVPQICRWFGEHDFEQLWVSQPVHKYGVGVHRYRGEPQPLAMGTRLFTFIR
jgi:hypothetical protein